MDMTGQQLIAASREEVWNALNDPDVLRACIPGCQELTKSSDTQMSAIAIMKVGPVKARFQGAVTLSELNPPNGYTITGEGQGGVAGFAKGVATVRLEDAEGGTVLNYTVDAQIGGKLSQLGGRLIDVTAKRMSGQFFEKFAEKIQLRQNPAQPSTQDEPAAPAGQLSVPPADAAATPRPTTAAAPVRQFAATPPASPASGMIGLTTIALVVFVAVIVAMWAMYGGLLPSLAPLAGTHVSPDFASIIQLIMAAAIGYLFGSRSRTK